jgi:VIT1/CCC1 family predicted Fe2+/Mn2+ transporter
VVLILGFANLIGDGLSMGVGSYVSTKSRQEYENSERDRETWEVEHYPQGEKDEIREIYRRKGFSGVDLDRAVEIITSDKKLWVETMMHEELGILEENSPPVLNGLSTFISFVIAGFIPLLFFVIARAADGLEKYTFIMSLLLTGITLFGVGSLRVLVTRTKWWRSGLEMLIIGGMAALGAYFIGYMLRGLA